MIKLQPAKSCRSSLAGISRTAFLSGVLVVFIVRRQRSHVFSYRGHTSERSPCQSMGHRTSAWGAAVSDKIPRKVVAKDWGASIVESTLDDLTKKELQHELRKLGCKVSGNKAELLDRVKAELSDRGKVQLEDVSTSVHGSRAVPVAVGSTKRYDVTICSGDEFCISATCFSPAVRQQLEHGAGTNAKLKEGTRKAAELWFPLEHFDQLCKSSAIRILENSSMPPAWVVNAILHTHCDDVEKIALPLKRYTEDFPEIMCQLSDPQKQNLQFAFAREGRVFLADEMGLGKSLSALTIAQAYSEEWPILIIAPKIVLLNWHNEVGKWLPHLTCETQVIEKKYQKVDPRMSIVITSYDIIAGCPELCVRADGAPYEVVIVDEAHFIKTPSTLRAKTLLPICQKARRCVFLSGTPVLNCAAESWVSLAALLCDKCGSFESFLERYSKFSNTTGTPRPVGVKNSEELHILLGSIMSRHNKQSSMPQLGEKHRVRVDIPMDQIDPRYATKILNLYKRAAFRARKGIEVQRYAVTAQAKAKVVPHYVEHVLQDELQDDEKVVVFAYHHILLDSVERHIKKLGVRCIRIDGRVASGSHRQNLIADFQNNAETRVALMAITAAGQGISLTAAHVAIFAELHWVPSKLLQAEDRLHRVGQERSVEIRYCAIDDDRFADNAMFKRLRQKEIVMDRIVEGKFLPKRFSSMATHEFIGT